MGCNGMANVEVRVPGVSAHSARPWQGKNAIAEGVDWLSTITKVPVKNHIVQGLEFRETLQVTKLRAGTARNVVPAEMKANLNHRFPPGRTVEQAIAGLRALVPQGSRSTWWTAGRRETCAWTMPRCSVSCA
jgi:succinyl-diaminopimelate desuccinylase